MTGNGDEVLLSVDLDAIMPIRVIRIRPGDGSCDERFIVHKRPAQVELDAGSAGRHLGITTRLLDPPETEGVNFACFFVSAAVEINDENAGFRGRKPSDFVEW